MSIKTYKELEKALTKAVQSGMKESDIAFEDLVKGAITDVVYNSYSPRSYSRTYALQNSLDTDVKNTKRGAVTKVFHDKSKMSYRSIINGEKVHNLPYIVHEGKVGRIFGYSEYPFYAPRPYMKKAKEDVAKRGANLLKIGLELSGYSVK